MRLITYSAPDNEMHLNVDPTEPLVRIECDNFKPLVFKPEEARELAKDLIALADQVDAKYKKD
jgi:hypothetical protein